MLLIYTKALFELKSENSNHFAGFAWVLIEPLLYISLLYFIFGHIFERGGVEYIIFLSSGIFVWLIFSKTLASSINLLIQNQSVIESFQLKHSIIFLTNLLKNIIRVLPLILLVFIFYIYLNDFNNLKNIFFLLLTILSLILFSFQCSQILSSLNIYIREINMFLPLFLTIILFCSGVFYDINIIKEKNEIFVMINPIANYISIIRDIVLNNSANTSLLMYLITIQFFIFMPINFLISKIEKNTNVHLISW